MSSADTFGIRLRGEHGYTLIELLVAMALGLIVSLAAFSLLEFTSSDVSRITGRVHVDQTGRVALEKIMLQLHSACVVQSVVPIQASSTAEKLRFISETSPLNTKNEPTSSLSTVRLHEIAYSKAKGTLVEESWPSTSASKPPEYKFNELEPTKRTLLTSVEQTEAVPIFQYYRYWKEGDTGFQASEDAGKLNPTSITAPFTEAEAKTIAKVTVNFTLAPEGHESSFAKGDRPVALEDSAIFRLAPSSEETGESNFPCSTPA
ncbi:MAG TPA: prepilin-type N-terminal cleavage/methylation domain-containing protein [Solirubrobacteraceae bacterium]|nr:prepilin-type N-terminal cleavage/methylation domain-containing protein [Solirubrobacteraceae bacterium]